MSTFHGGPAAALHLLFARGPLYLRVVQGPHGFDVLDQPDDEPEDHETVHVYRRIGESRRGHLLYRGRGKKQSGWYEFADYEHVDVDPETREQLRELPSWQEWASAQSAAVRKSLPDPDTEEGRAAWREVGIEVVNEECGPLA